MRKIAMGLGLTLLQLALLLPAVSSNVQAAEDPDGITLPDGVSHVVSTEGVHEYRLDNGLDVILWPDPSKATTTVNITYLVGSLHEAYGETGMAHLLEHLLFKGSTNHPNIPDELTAHGARPNGSTWYDRTNYFETFSATEENLEWALDLEADRMVNSFVRQEDLDSEMTVVRNEFEIGENDPEAILEERIYSTAFLWHNYGNTTIGARSDIENVPIERLRAFYRTWYRPENAILTIAGKFDPQKTIELVKEKFGPLTNPNIPTPPVYTKEPAQDGERRVSLRRVGEVQIVAAGYHIPSGAHPDFAPLQVLAHILTSAPSGRLHESLVETGMASSVDGRADRFQDPALFFLQAEVPKDKDLAPVEAELLRAAQSVPSNPPTQEEVERAVNALRRQWEQTQRNTSWAAINVSEWASMGDWRLMFLHRDRLAKVTPDDVARVADTYLQSSNRTVGVYLPTDAADRVEIPETPELDTMLASYSGGEGMAMGEDFDPSPDNIESRLQRMTLANGMDVLLLPKKTRGETVNLELSLWFGDLESLSGRAQVARMTAGMLDRGTENRSRQTIRDELDRLQATMRVRGSENNVSASMEATRGNFIDALEILGDVLRNPAFDPEELKQLEEEMRVRLEEQKTSPRSQVWTTLGRHLHPYDPDDIRYSMTPEEALERLAQVDAAALEEFHSTFYGADHGQLAIVGDFDVAEVQPLLERFFSHWTSSVGYTRIVNDHEDRPALVDRIQIADKESASMAAGLRSSMSDDDPEYPAATLGGFMLGGGFLNSRLATRIRQEEGLSYSVYGWFNAPAMGNDAQFGAFAMYAPQNDARLMDAFKDEMQKAVKVPFTADEVEEAKSGWLQRRQVSRSSDDDLAEQLIELSRNDRTMMWEARFEDQVRLVTPEAVTAAMERIIIPGQISIVRAGDFEKAAAAATESGAGNSSSLSR